MIFPKFIKYFSLFLQLEATILTFIFLGKICEGIFPEFKSVLRFELKCEY